MSRIEWRGKCLLNLHYVLVPISYAALVCGKVVNLLSCSTRSVECHYLWIFFWKFLDIYLNF